MIKAPLEYKCQECGMTINMKEVTSHKGNECMMEKMNRELESEMWWHQG